MLRVLVLGMCSSVPANHQASSQAATSQDINFDLSEKTFSAIFQNIKSWEYADINLNYLSNQLEHLSLFHLNIRSLQKNFDDLHEQI